MGGASSLLCNDGDASACGQVQSSSILVFENKICMVLARLVCSGAGQATDRDRQVRNRNRMGNR